MNDLDDFNADEVKELTDQQQKFITALFGDALGNPKKAGEIAGYAPSSYPKVVKALKDEILERNKFDPVVKKQKNIPYLVDQHLLEKENA